MLLISCTLAMDIIMWDPLGYSWNILRQLSSSRIIDAFLVLLIWPTPVINYTERSGQAYFLPKLTFSTCLSSIPRWPVTQTVNTDRARALRLTDWDTPEDTMLPQTINVFKMSLSDSWIYKNNTRQRRLRCETYRWFVVVVVLTMGDPPARRACWPHAHRGLTS